MNLNQNAGKKVWSWILGTYFRISDMYLAALSNLQRIIQSLRRRQCCSEGPYPLPFPLSPLSLFRSGSRPLAKCNCDCDDWDGDGDRLDRPFILQSRRQQNKIWAAFLVEISLMLFFHEKGAKCECTIGRLKTTQTQRFPHFQLAQTTTRPNDDSPKQHPTHPQLT